MDTAKTQGANLSGLRGTPGRRDGAANLGPYR